MRRERFLELLDQEHEALCVDSLVLVLRVVPTEQDQRPARLCSLDLTAKVRWASAEDVAQVPAHTRGIALAAKRVFVRAVEVLDAAGEILVLPEVDVGCCETTEECSARYAGATHLREGVVAQVRIAVVDLSDVRENPCAELDGLGLSAWGDAQRDQCHKRRSDHRSTLFGRK